MVKHCFIYMVLYGFVRNLTNKNGGMDNDGIMGIYIYIYNGDSVWNISGI